MHWKNEPLIYQGYQCGAVCLPEGCLGHFPLKRVTGTVCLRKVEDSNTACISILFSDEDCYSEHDGRIYLMFVSPEDGEDEEVWSIHPDLLT
jgi:hypothetical protein